VNENGNSGSMSLKWRILLPVIAVVLIAGVVTAFLAINITSDRIETEIKNRGASITLSLAQGAPNAILTEDALTLSSLVTKAKGQKDVVYAFIADEDKKVLAHSPKQNFDSRLLLANPVTREGEPFFKVIKLNNRYVLDIGYAIKGNIGTAHIGLDMSVIENLKSEIAFKTGGAILVVVSIGVILVFYIANTIIRPITHLTDVANRISLGELDIYIDVTSRDEIGILADAINRLRKSMKQAMKQLGAVE
jgi:HAMP domain-containing protein